LKGKRYDVYKQDYKVRQLRNMPPKLEIGLNGVNIPPINFPTLPDGVTQEQIQELVKQVFETNAQEFLNNAVREATREVLNNLPHAGFERTVLNPRWEQEV